jgi:hypothetical protein
MPPSSTPGGTRHHADALAASERELARERQHLDDAERRGRLAAEISDAETVAVAERFAARHRERVDVLERKIAVQRDELAITEREYETMRAEVQAARGAVGTPPPAPEPEEDHLRGQMDRAAREAAADRQLEFLKKKVRATHEVAPCRPPGPGPGCRRAGRPVLPATA